MSNATEETKPDRPSEDAPPVQPRPYGWQQKPFHTCDPSEVPTGLRRALAKHRAAARKRGE